MRREIMTIEENKALARRFIEEVFNKGNTGAIADSCVPGSMLVGGLTGQIGVIRTAFPDFHITIEDIVAERNKVVAITTSRGTNTGPLMGLPALGRLPEPVPPTGKSFLVTGVNVFTIKDGRVLSFATESDQVGLLRQLGWSITPPNQQ
jgi:predicted ester cyclase